MSAIPSIPAAENKAAVPVPHHQALSVVSGLSPEAQRAVDTDPAEIVRRWIVRRWIAGLSDGCRRKYRQAAREFCHWALHRDDAVPEDALRILVQAGAGHQLLAGFRDHLLQTRGLSTSTVAGQLTGLCSLVGACRQAGLTSWRPEKVAPRVEKRVDRSGPHGSRSRPLSTTWTSRLPRATRWRSGMLRS